MKRCFFLGHRDAPESISADLVKVLETLIIESMVEEFIVGNYGRFDILVQSVLVQLKEKYPYITLTLLLPYHPAVKAVTLPKGFDQTFYPENMEKVPKRYAIVKANQAMVDYCDYLVAYLRYPGTNTGKLVEFAKKKESKGEIKVILI